MNFTPEEKNIYVIAIHNSKDVLTATGGADVVLKIRDGQEPLKWRLERIGTKFGFKNIATNKFLGANEAEGNLCDKSNVQGPAQNFTFTNVRGGGCVFTCYKHTDGLVVSHPEIGYLRAVEDWDDRVLFNVFDVTPPTH